jgi:class 3 adenylate cyclase/tetratricopeptide (TPR) repeat protein
MVDPPSCSVCGRIPSQGAEFCGGCGSPLPRRCTSCGHANPAGNLFCESCGQRLAQAPGATATLTTRESARGGERRYLTVMFCDLVGSTALSAVLDPEDMRRLIQGYQARCLEVITAYDGSVAQFLGDGILAYFGYPAAHEDDAADAVRAALGITRAMAPLADELGVEHLAARVGLHTGLVVVGEMVGKTDAPFGADVLAIGETPNIAARLQSLAQPGEVVIGGSTAELVRGYFVLESLGYPELKGAGRPIEVLRVSAETSARSRLDVMLSRGLIPMVGRDRELGHLESAWHAAQRGAGSVMLIDGEPGIGKSRLVLELMERVVASSSPVVDLRCSPRHANSVLHPLVNLLQRILEPADLADPEGLLDQVERLVVGSGLELADGVPVVAALVGLTLPDHYAPLPTAPELLKERTRSVLTRLILGRSRGGLLLLVEDVQWLDPTSQEVVGELLEAASGHGVLAVLTRRSGTSPDWPPEPDVTFTLGRLDESAIGAMVSEIAGDDGERNRLVREVVARTDGVPLYIEELTAMLLDLSNEPEGADQPTGPVVPSTLRDLLMARLDGIGPAAQVARLASCVGREVPYGFLRLLWSHDEALLVDHLQHLLDSGLMRFRGDGAARTYLFKHALVQEVAYDTLLRSERQRHHLAIAEAMEAASDSVTYSPELLAHHFADAGLPERALPYALAAGLHAIERSANREAVAHLQSCLDLVRSLPASEEHDRLELTVLVHLGAPMMSTRGYGSVEVEEVYRRAQELGTTLGDPLPLFEALYGMYRMHLLRAEYPIALGISDRLLELADLSGRPAFQVAAQRAAGSAEVYRGDDLDDALEHLSAAVRIDRSLVGASLRQGLELNDVADPAIVSLSYGAWVLWLRDDRAGARSMSDDAIARAAQLGHPFTISLATCFDLWLRQFDHEAADVATRAEAATTYAAEQGFDFWLGWAAVLHGWAVARLGAPEDGIAMMRKGLVDWQATGSRLGTSYFLTLLADGQALAGRTEEAIETLAESEKFGLEVGEHFWLPETYRSRASLLAASDPDQATDLLRRAVALADRQGSVVLGRRARQALSSPPEVATRS